MRSFLIDSMSLVSSNFIDSKMLKWLADDGDSDGELVEVGVVIVCCCCC